MQTTASSQSSDWIDTTHTTQASINTLQDQFHMEPKIPIQLFDFLSPLKATMMAECLAAISSWQRSQCILAIDGQVKEINEDEWRQKPLIERWSSQDTARPLTSLINTSDLLSDKHRFALQQFIIFAILGSEFKDWLAKVLQIDLDKSVTCEIVRYQTGDFITQHSDTHDTRIVGVNFYLDPSYADEKGGELIYKNEVLEEFTIKPKYNSISMIPIKQDCSHWVLPWRDMLPGRHTFSLSYRPVAKKGESQ